MRQANMHNVAALARSALSRMVFTAGCPSPTDRQALVCSACAVCQTAHLLLQVLVQGLRGAVVGHHAGQVPDYDAAEVRLL